MSDPSQHRPQLTDHDDAEAARYQALSSLAVVGLVLGMLGFAALFEPWLWVVPLLGLLTSGLALRRIARDAPALSGRRTALAGLVLSVLFSAAVPANWLVYRWLVRCEAQRFAACWFEFLADGQPQKAHQLTQHPAYRQPLDERLADWYQRRRGRLDQLQWYVAASPSEPRWPVHTLLTLGNKARVRYHQTTDQTRAGRRDLLCQVYAVTYEKDGREKSFFVELHLERWQLDSSRANWQILGAAQPQIDVLK